MKRWMFCSIFLLYPLLISLEIVLALAPCQSGGLTTSVHKDFQMMYPDQDFLQIDNKEYLKDIEQLKDLACLQYLDATAWGIKGDIANLKNLKNLEVLSLYGNPEVYGDVCSTGGLIKLKALKLAFDPGVYGDIFCLKDLKLETFAMTSTNISGDLADLSHMTNLKAIYIAGTGISGDISSLSHLTNLEELGISDEFPGNPSIIGDLATLDNLTKLKKVSLYGTGATNCEHFTKMHPNIPQGGCLTESLNTLMARNVRAEEKISKDRLPEGPPALRKEEDTKPEKKPDEANEMPAGTYDREVQAPVRKKAGKNIIAAFFSWLKNLFHSRLPSSPEQPGSLPDAKEQSPLPDVQTGSFPKECIKDGTFIGEAECQAMIGQARPENALDSGPPKECTTEGKFIGEDKCRAMMQQAPQGNGPDSGPPKECTIDGKFIGQSACKAMMEKGSRSSPESSMEQQPQA